jgi:hypothetical protein
VPLACEERPASISAKKASTARQAAAFQHPVKADAGAARSAWLRRGGVEALAEGTGMIRPVAVHHEIGLHLAMTSMERY